MPFGYGFLVTLNKHIFICFNLHAYLMSRIDRHRSSCAAPLPPTHTRIELYISSIKHLSILFTSNDNEANADVFACRKRSERPPAKTNKTKMAKNQRNIALIEITILGVRCAPYQMREMAPIASDFLDNYILRMANDGRNLSANA